MEILNCQHCGRMYVGRPNSNYCSALCSRRAYVVRWRARGKQRQTWAARLCPICGRGFVPTVHNQVTCGRARCHAVYMMTKYKRRRKHEGQC